MQEHGQWLIADRAAAAQRAGRWRATASRGSGFVAIAVVAVLIGAMLLVKVADVGYRHYTAQFLQAAALQAGNPITIAGIPVGEVTSMKLAGDHVEAGLKVRDDVALGEDSRAIIKVTTILGSRYLALQPAGPGSLPDNTFDLDHTEVPYDLQEALADVTTTYEQVDSDKFARDARHPRQAVGKAFPRCCRRRWRTPTPCRRSSPTGAINSASLLQDDGSWSATRCAASSRTSAA